MLHLAVCDDDPIHGRRICEILRAQPPAAEWEVRSFQSPQALLQAVEQGYAPRISILDIQMDGMSGIELAKRLNDRLPRCAVIFVTSYLGFATEVYEARHTYFILKSQLEQRIGRALEQALEQTAAPPELHYSTQHGYRNVPCGSVLYLERVLRKTRVVLTGGQEDLTAAPPTALLNEENGGWFIRCHQSFWVNFPQIQTMESDCFLLRSGCRVPISRTYRAAARTQFFDCLQKSNR